MEELNHRKSESSFSHPSDFLQMREREIEERRKRLDRALEKFKNLINQPWVNLATLQEHRRRLEEEQKINEAALVKSVTKHCDWYINSFQHILEIEKLVVSCVRLSHEKETLYLTMLHFSISGDAGPGSQLFEKQQISAKNESDSANSNFGDDGDGEDDDYDVVDAGDEESSFDGEMNLSAHMSEHQVFLPREVFQFLEGRSCLLHYLLEQVPGESPILNINKLTCVFFNNIIETSKTFALAFNIESAMKMPSTADSSTCKLPSSLFTAQLQPESLHFPVGYPLACFVVWVRKEMNYFLDIFSKAVCDVSVPPNVLDESLLILKNGAKELKASIGLDIFFYLDKYLIDLFASKSPNESDEDATTFDDDDETHSVRL